MQTKSNQNNFSTLFCLSEAKQYNICLNGVIGLCTTATAHGLFGKYGWLKSEVNFSILLSMDTLSFIINGF